MRIDDAIKRIQALQQSPAHAALPVADRAAIAALLDAAKRIVKLRAPIRMLERAVNPDDGDHLNQERLFED